MKKSPRLAQDRRRAARARRRTVFAAPARRAAEKAVRDLLDRRDRGDDRPERRHGLSRRQLHGGIGPATGRGAAIDETTGLPDLRLAKPDGFVETAAPDGAGGFYISGNFTRVGDRPRTRLAHIDAHGDVTPWNPGADNERHGARGLRLDGLGRRRFTASADSRATASPRSDAVTGTPTAWNPDVDSDV